jgi:hypothetical protein
VTGGGPILSDGSPILEPPGTMVPGPPGPLPPNLGAPIGPPAAVPSDGRIPPIANPAPTVPANPSSRSRS